jgi:predicted Zn-dependent protease
MGTAMIDRLEALLASGRDGALLRHGLGNALLAAGRAEEAVAHLTRAVEHDPGYSAAWKLLGRALAESGHRERAREAFDRGIEVAETRGDLQAAREMRVFRRRLEG